MTGFFKKLMASGTALTLGLSAMAFADQYQYNNGCAQPCNPCHTNNCGNGNWCDNLRLDASFLYWKVSGDELDYAYDYTTLDNEDFRYTRKRYHNVSGDYDPGFKIGLGIDFPCICWDTDLIWTHFDTKNSSHHESEFRGTPASSFVAIPFFKESEITLTAGDRVNATGSMNFKYDVIDLEFGKWICCNSCLLFRPHVGFRAVDIREKFHSQLDHFSTDGTPTALLTDYRAHINNEFKGVGVRAGLDTDLQLCEGWSVIGRAAAAIVWGNTKIRNDFDSLEIDSQDFATRSHETDHYRHSRAFTDLSLGIRYRSCYCQCPFSIEAAWEHHYLFNQHRFFASDYLDSEHGYNFKKNGDVSLQGLTVTLGLEF